MMKTFKVFAFCIATILVLMSFVSAATTFSVSTTSVSFTPGDSSHDITITNPNAPALLSVNLNMPTVDGVAFQVTGTTTGINASSVLTITPTTAIDFEDLEFGESFTGSLVITDMSNSSEIETIEIKIEKDTFCDFENPGDLDVKIKDVKNKGIGDDDKWFSLDTIEIKVDIDNKGNDDIDKIEIEWGLYDDSNNEWIIEPIAENDFNLKDGKDDSVTFTLDLYNDLDIDLEDLTSGDYTLYVRATGEVDNTGNNDTCTSDSESIEIVIEENYVVLDDIKLIGNVACGATLQLSADVFNIGEEDEEDVYIMIYNTELGINERAEMRDIDAYEDKELIFDFTLDRDLDEKTYYLRFDVFDDRDDIYENEDDEKSRYDLPLIVSGNCQSVPQTSVFASLESGGEAGEEMEILATVQNTGEDSATFTIKAADYASWAELVEVSPSTITLNAGASQDVMITLNVDSDADESENFNIVVESESGDAVTQPVAVTIEQGFSFSNLFGDNAYIWGIVILNIILVVIIIIVALKVARS